MPKEREKYVRAVGMSDKSALSLLFNSFHIHLAVNKWNFA